MALVVSRASWVIQLSNTDLEAVSPEGGAPESPRSISAFPPRGHVLLGVLFLLEDSLLLLVFVEAFFGA